MKERSMGVAKFDGKTVISSSNFLSFSAVGLKSSRSAGGRDEMYTAVVCDVLGINLDRKDRQKNNKSH